MTRKIDPLFYWALLLIGGLILAILLAASDTARSFMVWALAVFGGFWAVVFLIAALAPEDTETPVARKPGARKTAARRSARQRGSPELVKRINTYTHDDDTSYRLLRQAMVEHPDRSAEWCADKVIWNLTRDRR